jgi:hypothetical protein
VQGKVGEIFFFDFSPRKRIPQTQKDIQKYRWGEGWGKRDKHPDTCGNEQYE